MPMEIRETKSAEKDLIRAPKEVLISYEAWARLIEEHGLAVLRKFKGYHDERLSGDMKGYRSSRLNKKWRVVYAVDSRCNVKVVEVVRITPHDYRRKK